MEHKGIAITFNEGSGNFTARDKHGKMVRSGSLAGIKKALDKADVFESFTAYIEGRGWGRNKPHEKITVVGIKQPRKSASAWRSDSKPQWLSSDGETRLAVYADTPENVALLAALVEVRVRHEAENKAQSERHAAEIEAAEAPIAVLKPE